MYLIDITPILVLSGGIVGLLGMTWAFPLLGRALRGAQNDREQTSSGLEQMRAFELQVLIPVHNEESSVADTLDSVRQAIAFAERKGALFKYKVLVGADHCSDNTVQISKSCGAEVIEFRERTGKWRVLQELVRQAQGSEWVVLADAGVRWPQTLIWKLFPFLFCEDYVGIAPSYQKTDGGKLESLHWKLESHLKLLEAESGGPVTTHGATVLYRQSALQETLSELERENWLNDDVVIPLQMRALFPDKKIAYFPQLSVTDFSQPQSVHTDETVRRRRMVIGNIQWVRHLLFKVARRNPVAACVALRRVFRVLWAYWVGLSLLGILALSGLGINGFVAVLCTALLMIIAFGIRSSKPAILVAARESLFAPYYFLSSNFSPSVGWR